MQLDRVNVLKTVDVFLIKKNTNYSNKFKYIKI